MLTIKTTRFGEVEIDKNLAIHFPDGLLGFPEQKDYIILEHKPGSPFCWLQSVTDHDLAFVMTNPFLLKEDYLENLPPDDQALFFGENGKEHIVFALATIPQGKAENTTINLLGPLVIDPGSKTGRQVILANSGYNHRHPMISQ
jgi:flagellar assembly factor FliW